MVFKNFEINSTAEQRIFFEQWSADTAFWLEEYATFAAMKIISGGLSWIKWDKGWKFRDSYEIQKFREKHALAITFQKFVLWQFFRQWTALRKYANQKGIRIIGDLPIFVAHDIAEVWSNPELFKLDANQQPNSVAGVPPDYFSETGQHWGNLL